MFKQHVSKVVSLSLFVTLLFQSCPMRPSSFTDTVSRAVLNKFSGSILIGTGWACLQGWLTAHQYDSLKFAPSGRHKQELEEMITACGLDPKDISLKYKYTGGALGESTFDMVAVDPALLSIFEEDPEAVKANTIIELLYEPNLSETVKERLSAIKAALSPGAQRFILKHELGHIAHSDVKKRLCVIWVKRTAAAYLAFVAANTAIIKNRYLAVLAWATTSRLSNQLFDYLSDHSIKLYEEKEADAFAVRHSSREDIEATADFFEKHQEILDTHQEPDVAWLVHLDGKLRACDLRELAEQKDNPTSQNNLDSVVQGG